MKAITIIHIIAGTIALLFGLAAIFARKGSQIHRFCGRLFFVTMTFVCVAALILHLSKNLYFLPAVGVFSFYLSYTGFRAFKRVKKGTNLADYLVSVICMLAGLGLVAVSATQILCGNAAMAPVSGSFAIACLVLSLSDIRNYRSGRKPARVIEFHLQRMGGAYIAAVTALLVVNAGKISWVQAHPNIWPLVWFLPTIVGSLLITNAIKAARK